MPILWKLDVRLDSPLVLGACCEDTLRTDFGQALVGLMGQYVRMLVGKHVGSVEKVMEAQMLVCGAAGGKKSPREGICYQGTPFAVTVENTNSNIKDDGLYAQRIDAHHVKVSFALDPKLFQPVQIGGSSIPITDVLWPTIWMAFALGSMGKGSRRSQGSMSITGAELNPGTGAFSTLPVFPEASDFAAWKEWLTNGYTTATKSLRVWCQQMFPDDQGPCTVLPQLPELTELYVSVAARNDARASRLQFAKRLSAIRNELGSLNYAASFGSIDPRRPSPVQAKTIRTSDGFRQVVRIPGDLYEAHFSNCEWLQCLQEGAVQ